MLDRSVDVVGAGAVLGTGTGGGGVLSKISVERRIDLQLLENLK